MDNRRVHIAASPITGRIYAGKLLRDNCTWADGKADVTGPACAAVALHATQAGGTIVVMANGCPRWEISVKELAA